MLSSRSSEELTNHEIYMGDVIKLAIKSNILVDSVVFENGKCLDIGTPDDLQKAGTFLG
jgi:glucose-1-phosphate thymidylyltransferase